MFFFKNSLNITTAGSTISPDLLYTYYTFDSADINSTSVKNIAPATPIYDATLSSALMVDSTNNITGTSDINLTYTLSQFVTLPSLDIGNSTGLSIMFWLRCTSTTYNIRVFDFGNGPASDNIEVYTNATGVLFLNIYKGATPTPTSPYNITTVPINDNCYRHIGITMDSNGTFKYYLNGLWLATTTGNQYPNTVTRTQNFIGKNSNNAYYLNGGIGEFRIYNNVVSDAVVLNCATSNTRINKLSNMSFYYKFKSVDLINSRIKNYVSGVYDLSFLVPITAFSLTSTSAQIGITTGTQKNNTAVPPVAINSRYSSQFLYNIPGVNVATGNPPSGASTDPLYGLQLYNSSFTAPPTGGFTINFWIYIISNASTYNLPFISLNESTSTRRIAIGTNYAIIGTAPTTRLYVDQLSSKTQISIGNFANTSWRQVSLVVNYNNSSITTYVDITGTTPFTTTLPYQDYSNCNFINCVFMNDIQNIYSPFNSYDRPVRAFMENFRIYNVPLSVSELRALSVQTSLDSVV